MARQVTIPTPPQFAEVAKLQSLLEPIKAEMRVESQKLRNSKNENPDYNHYIYVGSRELAILDSLRFLRNIAKDGNSASQILDKFQARISVEVDEALTRKTLQNDYEKMLGKGAEEGYIIVQEKLDSVRSKLMELEVREPSEA